MKKILIVFVSLITTYNLFAQDLIITKHGDSIYCKINSIRNNVLKFSYDRNNEKADSSVVKNDVLKHYYKYDPEKIGRNPFYPKQYEISITEGTSVFLDKIHYPANFPFNFSQFNENVTAQDIGFKYFINNSIGIGIQFNGITAYGTKIQNLGDYNGLVSLTQQYTLSAVTISTRRLSQNLRHRYLFTYGTGISTYLSSGSYSIFDPDFTHASFRNSNLMWGNFLQASYDYFLLKWLSAGAQLRFSTSTAKGNPTEYGHYSAIGSVFLFSTFDATFAMRFHF